ncbi:MAG: DUF1338 domain-containing protein [Planctomycetota bacterium]|nr:DUF1338 domain-containing protein [Planctomycetota bacterium]
MSNLRTLLDRLWTDYAELNPQAGQIHRLLGQAGETVVNDHIALRTFDDPRVSLDVLARAFTDGGYQPRNEYHFPEKHLFARHFEHPSAEFPKVFISELKLGQFPADIARRITALLDQMDPSIPARWDFPVVGRPWRVSYADYEALRAQSEYAAWVAAWGFRANHFTVLVNELRTFRTLQELNGFLTRSGFELNVAGGEIKGTPADGLEQSSTLANHASVNFIEGPRVIPGCYYEFARRHPMPDGRLYGGFVARSADKIFESTNRR